MANKLIRYAGALMLLQALTACSGEKDAENQAIARPDFANISTNSSAVAADQRLIVAFGDSLYAGYGVLPQQGFAMQLEKSLNAGGIAAKVQNAGVSGDTSAAGLRRLAFTLDGLERKPDLVMVNLGGNDMLRGIDPKETRANLTAICEELKRRDIKIMLTGMIAAPNLGPDYAAQFNPIYPELAKAYDATLYPFFLDQVVTDSNLMLPDRIHPNPKGLEKITQLVTPFVAKAVASD